MKPEEQPVLLKELGSSPVAMCSAERGSLLVLLAAGALGDVLEHQAGAVMAARRLLAFLLTYP